MNDARDNNYVSVGSWMWMMFVTAIPVIGLLMVLIWALSGENESRKNYFRAIIAWILVFAGILMLLAFLGHVPVLKEIQSLTHRS